MAAKYLLSAVLNESSNYNVIHGVHNRVNCDIIEERPVSSAPSRSSRASHVPTVCDVLSTDHGVSNKDSFSSIKDIHVREATERATSNNCDIIEHLKSPFSSNSIQHKDNSQKSTDRSCSSVDHFQLLHPHECSNVRLTAFESTATLKHILSMANLNTSHSIPNNDTKHTSTSQSERNRDKIKTEHHPQHHLGSQTKLRQNSICDSVTHRSSSSIIMANRKIGDSSVRRQQQALSEPKKNSISFEKLHSQATTTHSMMVTLSEKSDRQKCPPAVLLMLEGMTPYVASKFGSCIPVLQMLIQSTLRNRRQTAHVNFIDTHHSAQSQNRNSYSNTRHQKLLSLPNGCVLSEIESSSHSVVFAVCGTSKALLALEAAVRDKSSYLWTTSPLATQVLIPFKISIKCAQIINSLFQKEDSNTFKHGKLDDCAMTSNNPSVAYQISSDSSIINKDLTDYVHKTTQKKRSLSNNHLSDHNQCKTCSVNCKCGLHNYDSIPLTPASKNPSESFIQRSNSLNLSANEKQSQHLLNNSLFSLNRLNSQQNSETSHTETELHQFVSNMVSETMFRAANECTNTSTPMTNSSNFKYTINSY